MQYIGKLDKEKLGRYKHIIITEEVIITEERITHIKEHHPELINSEIIYIKDVLEDPDYIFEDRKNIDTILMVKNIDKTYKDYRLVVKLNTNTNINLKEKSNTIISFWKINKKKLGQFIRNES